jgi:hypothetical protein
MAGKSPGFWFFTGDWLKDPELRFCSIFARGLLVDLLCILFEANERGYASKPDGSPRTNEEIVSAVSGGRTEEKLAALAELESSGVLSRDIRGVLFSRRLARLGEIKESRTKAGSKGGTKAQANAKQTSSKSEANGEQTHKQKRGVSDSVSDSVSGITHTHSQPSRDSVSVPDELAACWHRWSEYVLGTTGKAVNAIQAEVMLMDLGRRGAEKAARDIDFSIRKSAKSILDSDNDFEKQATKPRTHILTPKPRNYT